MELSNEFEVNLPFDEAWSVLTDLPRLAPCLPGAHLDSLDGDEPHGTIEVKVGPIAAHYEGKAHIVEQDVEGGRIVLVASGKDTNGQGTASVTVTALLRGDERRTHVSLLTDLTISGKVAQFGRGDLAEVSARVMDRFVENFESMIVAPSARSGAAGASLTASRGAEAVVGERTVDVATIVDDAPVLRSVGSSDPVDLLEVGGPPVIKRLLPFVAAGIALALLVRALRRRRA